MLGFVFISFQQTKWLKMLVYPVTGRDSLFHTIPPPKKQRLGYPTDRKGIPLPGPTPGVRCPGQEGEEPHSRGGFCQPCFWVTPRDKLGHESGRAQYLLPAVPCGREQSTSGTTFPCRSQFQSVHLSVWGFWFCLPVRRNRGQSAEFSSLRL